MKETPKLSPVPDWVAESPVMALADAWASIDGRSTDFRLGRLAKKLESYGGHFAGYEAEAEEMIRRLECRGWVLSKKRNK